MVSFIIVFDCDIGFDGIEKAKNGYCFSGYSCFAAFFVELGYGFKPLDQFVQVIPEAFVQK